MCKAVLGANNCVRASFLYCYDCFLKTLVSDFSGSYALYCSCVSRKSSEKIIIGGKFEDISPLLGI